MENEFDKLTEAEFWRWIKTNFSEIKEYVLTQYKETKNLKKRLDEMLTRITSLEKNINDLMELQNTAWELHDLMELKNTAWELHEAYASFNSWIDQVEERISETEDQTKK